MEVKVLGYTASVEVVDRKAQTMLRTHTQLMLGTLAQHSSYPRPSSPTIPVALPPALPMNCSGVPLPPLFYVSPKEISG